MKIKLKDAFDLQIGRTPARSNAANWNGQYKWISITDLGTAGKYISTTKEKITDKGIDESGIKIVPKGTVVMSFKLSIGKTAITTEDMYTNEAIVAFNVRESIQVDSSYLYYLCCGNDWGEGTNKAVMGLTLNKATLSEKEIELPEIMIQREVAKKLDKLDKIIIQRKKQLQKLDELIQARFVELFGLPLDKSKANMRFTDCVEFNPKKSEVKDMQDVEVSFVPMECVGVDGSFNIRENGPVSNYYKGYTYFRDGDVLLAKITPCFENGKAAIAEGCKNGIGFGTTEFHVARPKAGVSNSYWIKYMLKNDSVHELATINMTGSAGQKRIQTPFFDKLTIYCPPIELQNQFADFVNQVNKLKFVGFSFRDFFTT